MNTIEIKKQLKKNIFDTLLPLIRNRRVVLLDAPYHTNIGDLLIWLGEYCFLRENNISLLYTRSCDTFHFEKIPQDVVILLHGGGNFGDAWRFFQDFKLSVVQNYPNNRIVFFPQSVFYNDTVIAGKDFEILKSHPDLHLMLRDVESKIFVEHYLNKNISVVPDMAFCLNDKILNKYYDIHIKNTLSTILYVKREDKESAENKIPFNLKDVLINDWPSAKRTPALYNIARKMIRYEHALYRRKFFMFKKYRGISDLFFFKIYLPYMIRMGINFVAPYKYIYSERLHVCILSVLLDKEVHILDNSYGKNSHFYHQWLNDVDGVNLVNEKL